MVAGLAGSRGRTRVFVICAMLIANCSRTSAPDARDASVGNRPVSSAVAEPSPDARRPPDLDAASSVGSSAAIADVLEYSTSLLGWRSHLTDIHRDDAFANAQALFLGRDLAISPLLDLRKSVAFANVFETVNGRRLHLGVVEVTFRRCADLDRTMTAVSRVHRDYFKVAALSVFRTIRRGRSLTFVFSESALEPALKDLLHSPPRKAFVSTECQDAPPR